MRVKTKEDKSRIALGKLMLAEDEFRRLANLPQREEHIFAHSPQVISAMGSIINHVSQRKLNPVRMYVQTIDEGGIPVHQLTIEFANYGD